PSSNPTTPSPHFHSPIATLHTSNHHNQHSAHFNDPQKTGAPTILALNSHTHPPPTTFIFTTSIQSSTSKTKKRNFYIDKMYVIRTIHIPLP
ncbi:hypothetical protein COCMIDRAFT_106533, partial [Bipolaris oryzae ATCC 44560]